MKHLMGCSMERVAIALVLLVVIVAGDNEGMAIWSEGSENPPGYAIWNETGGFSRSDGMRDFHGSWKAVRGAYSPNRDEAILIGTSFDDVVTAHIYSGGKWSELPFSPLHGAYQWAFNVQYESQSGNPLIVWHDRTMRVTKFATRTESEWELRQRPARNIRRDGHYDQFILEASPTRNEMMLVTCALGHDDAYAVVWDGYNWRWGTNVRGYSNRKNKYPVRVVYEQQAGRAFVVYAFNSKSFRYRIWSRGSKLWVYDGSVSPPEGYLGDHDKIDRTAVSGDPSSNRIVVAARSLLDKMWVTVWDYDDQQWIDLKMVTTKSLRITTQGQLFAVAFEGTSQRALLAYVQLSGIKYRTWSRRYGWSNEKQVPNLEVTADSVMLVGNNENDDIMLSLQDADSGSSFCKWDGSRWGEVQRMTNYSWESGISRYPLLFMWWKPPVVDTNSPTAFPTHHPTPLPTAFPTPTPTLTPTRQPTPQPTIPPTAFPTHSPTSTPSRKPTNQPTDVPTSPPTRTPTAQPSPSPTIFRTSLPTPVLTQPPTPMPSMKPTKFSDQSQSITKDKSYQALDSATKTVPTGHSCGSNNECQSNTCRNGVCMATSFCYPLKHKFEEPFFEHKVNIVFVASGFDTASKEEWHANVTRIYKSFEQYNMFSNEIEQLNMFRVDPGTMDSSYCDLGCLGITRLLCCDQNRALSLAQKCFPVGSNLQTVVVHNDKRYGGAGYVNSNIATVSTHPLASVVAAHELCHSLFDLTDEYTYGPGTDDEPNCDSTSSCEKWSDLIGDTPAGYDPVRCLPGCRNGNFYVGSISFMNSLNSPMGAVNERFACCTYCALTKSFPSYCDVFDKSPNYLLNYCKNNDYQGYGIASYDREPLQAISDGSIPDSSSKYVQVEYPVSVRITPRTRPSGTNVYKAKTSLLDSGMFLRSQVKGDFSSPKMALEQGHDSVLKMVVFYRTGKESFLFSRNTTIEVPFAQDPADDEEQSLAVSEEAESINAVLDTKGREVKRIRVRLMKLSKKKGRTIG